MISDRDITFILNKAYFGNYEQAIVKLAEIVSNQREQIFILQDRVSELEQQVRRLS